MPELYVGNEAEFEEEGCKIVALGDVEIGVFRVHGDFYAYRNVCAHRGGPVCQGRIMRKVEEILGEDKTSQGLRFSEEHVHIVCPWHGFEYDLKTGVHPGDSGVRLRKHKVEVRNGEVYVTL